MGKSRRHNKVVPQREFVIEADSIGDFLFKGFSYCAFRFIDLVRNIGHDFEACFSDSVGSAPACIANRKQRGAAPTAGDLGEEPVFDGVELGAIGRVVNHEDFDVEFFGEVEEVLLDNPVPAGVGATAVAEDGEGVGVGILPLEIFTPHFFEMVAEELGCVVACRDGHISGVVPDVVDAVGCYGGLGKSSEVMVRVLGKFALDTASGASHRERREIMPPLEFIERVKVCYFHLCEFKLGFFRNLCNVLEINYKDTKLFPVVCCI